MLRKASNASESLIVTYHDTSVAIASDTYIHFMGGGTSTENFWGAVPPEDRKSFVLRRSFNDRLNLKPESPARPAFRLLFSALQFKLNQETGRNHGNTSMCKVWKLNFQQLLQIQPTRARLSDDVMVRTLEMVEEVVDGNKKEVEKVLEYGPLPLIDVPRKAIKPSLKAKLNISNQQKIKDWGMKQKKLKQRKERIAKYPACPR